jgi:copper(I)-binding protein
MLRMSIIAAALLALVAASPAGAADVTAGNLKISGAWSRATPKGASVGAGYMTITNTGTAPDRLIGGTSDASSRFEVHEMRIDNGVMKMRALANGLEIKPGQTVELKPGGYHVMFVGLSKPLESGQTVKVTLTFEKAGKVDVEFPVKPIGGMGGMPMQHGY